MPQILELGRWTQEDPFEASMVSMRPHLNRKPTKQNATSTTIAIKKKLTKGIPHFEETASTLNTAGKITEPRLYVSSRNKSNMI